MKIIDIMMILINIINNYPILCTLDCIILYICESVIL